MKADALFNISAPFIARPVGTTLLTIGIMLAGIVSYFLMPVAPMPQVDYPVISVNASLPGASPEIVSTSVTTPLERHLGAIAGVTEMTSSSSTGSASITLVFGLDRNIDSAAREVQAAINASRADLPSSLRSNPQYRKANPSENPVVTLALTSETRSLGQIYDIAATLMQQRLAQIKGVGDVGLQGGSMPAIRVQLNPRALYKYGISMEDVRAAISTASANSPKGAVESGDLNFQIYTNDPGRVADDYRELIIAFRNNAPVRLGDVSDVLDSMENTRVVGLVDGKPGVAIQVMRQPGANIVETRDEILKVMPEIERMIPPDMKVLMTADRTAPIRASLTQTEHKLLIAIVLVVLSVFMFLGNVRSALVPTIAVPVSLLGTFIFMYLFGFSINSLTLMAITVCTGFVVDDAIVMLENISRHVEQGMSRMEAALVGAREVGFTVVAMSFSLMAVFIPIFLLKGVVGRVFREFAMTLSFAVMISLIVSLTLTPMMCARLLPRPQDRARSRYARMSDAWLGDLRNFYDRSLTWVMGHGVLTMLVLLATVILNVYLYIAIPKGFFPAEDTGRLGGGLRVDQNASYENRKAKFEHFFKVVQADPAVETVTGYVVGGTGRGATIAITLKPLKDRGGASTTDVANRLRPKMSMPGAAMFMNPAQEFRVGARGGNANYQYTLQGDDVTELRKWTLKLVDELEKVPQLVDVNSDQEVKGLETRLVIDRDAAARYGLNMNQVTNTLYNAFGQRQVATIYNPMNQYRIVMELFPEFLQSPESLKEVYVSASGGAVSSTVSTGAVAGTVSTGRAASSDPLAAEAAANAAETQRNIQQNALSGGGRGVSTGSAVSTRMSRMVPLSALAYYDTAESPLSVQHQGNFVAATVSFNLAEGVPLSQAVEIINQTVNAIGIPSSINGSFQGNASAFQSAISTQPVVILAALVALYIVLGILYENYLHPLTIISTLPSVGVGALAALLISRLEFSLIAFIGVILLIGIVMKNAIVMIDFAIDAQRRENLTPAEAMHRAAMLRFRPILMTTMAALLSALPLAIGGGEGTEMRRPLGIAMVGGLTVSQILTLYTTPVVYLYLERFRVWMRTEGFGRSRSTEVRA